ncbi:MAG: 1-hydroxycarotenoid 3,4-desaturase CrtD [Pseudomonadota bacterium]
MMLKRSPEDRVVIVGAGIGGLAAALRLSAAGRDVLVVEKNDHPGGKLRTVPSAAGPVDTGPTVLTMLSVFEDLFRTAGEDIHDHLTLEPDAVLARHWWPDGSSLDLHTDPEASADAVRAFAGPTAEAEFRAFNRSARRLYEAFERPVMQAARPNVLSILAASLCRPDLSGPLTPGRTLWAQLSKQFTDPRLRQLFGRYATYVGGSPWHSPAILSLIWHAEASGVWSIQGGMSTLARAVEATAIRNGASFQYGTAVDEIHCRKNGGFQVCLANGPDQTVDTVLFNGDPAALATGMLGPEMQSAVTLKGTHPRSLSAWVWAFAAKPSGRDLSHHNVFFNTHYRREFQAIAQGNMPEDMALYVCAQDRGGDTTPTGAERFEIIMNGAPVEAGRTPDAGEYDACLIRTFAALSQHGLQFDTLPDRTALSTPHDFAERFPGSAGSLYGLSPHGTMASFNRPTVRSRIPGLYLAGGGVHPGAGLPMAATSGKLAAEAILKDRASTSTSRRTATRGGMSTGYRIAEPTVSRSSGS